MSIVRGRKYTIRIEKDGHGTGEVATELRADQWFEGVTGTLKSLSVITKIRF